MKINDNQFESNDNPTSVQAVSSCMEIIHEMLIEPAIDRGDIDDTKAKVLALVGVTLCEIAERAEAWDNQRNDNLNENYRN
jgi:hypothetical protein